jgi:phosphoribosylanthranilate isomerase
VETLLSTLFQEPVVKICGIQDPTHAATAARAGADLLGMILAPSPRQISPQQAATVVQAAKATGGRSVLTVGVFVNATASEINEVIRLAGLDLIQLHGDEPPELLAELERPAIKAIRPRPGSSRNEVLAIIGPYLDQPIAPAALLVDGFSWAARGGSGVRADWNLISEIIKTVGLPILLAGGLTPANVAIAISTVHPAGVDTSSGVERDGGKSHELITSFVEEARAAFATMTKPSPAP